MGDESQYINESVSLEVLTSKRYQFFGVTSSGGDSAAPSNSMSLRKARETKFSSPVMSFCSRS